jgi:hypothetical protein
VLIQRATSLQVKRPQRGNGWRRNLELLAQMFEQIGRHALNRIERPSAHLEKSNLQRGAET